MGLGMGRVGFETVTGYLLSSLVLSIQLYIVGSYNMYVFLPLVQYSLIFVLLMIWREQKTRKILTAKIEQLNSAIDEVATQIHGDNTSKSTKSKRAPVRIKPEEEVEDTTDYYIVWSFEELKSWSLFTVLWMGMYETNLHCEGILMQIKFLGWCLFIHIFL